MGRIRAVAERLSNRPVKVIWFHDPGQRHFALAVKPVLWSFFAAAKFMAVLNRCQLLICNDSGPMHISAALDVPVVGIFGPGEPVWWAPL